MDAKSIGRKIYELRKQKGFTQRELESQGRVGNCPGCARVFLRGRGGQYHSRGFNKKPQIVPDFT